MHACLVFCMSNVDVWRVQYLVIYCFSNDFCNVLRVHYYIFYDDTCLFCYAYDINDLCRILNVE